MSFGRVQQAMLDLMDALSDNIVANEARADALFRSADELTDQFGGDALRDSARRHRVQVLELQGTLAALRERYAVRFHQKL